MRKKLYFIFIILIFISLITYIYKENAKEDTFIENISIRTRNGREYYVMENTYKGDYDLQYLDFMQHYAEWYSENGPSFSDWYNSFPSGDWDYISIPNNANIEASDIVPFDTEKIVTYTEYVNFCNEWGISQKYNDPSQKYIIYSRIQYLPYRSVIPELASIKYTKDCVELYILDYGGRAAIGLSGYVYIIPTNKSINSITRKHIITEEEFNNIMEFSTC